jgi:hypothetical protein
MTRRANVRVSPYSRLGWQVWGVLGCLAAFGLALIVVSICLLSTQLDTDRRIEANGLSAEGVITDLIRVNGTKGGYWVPKVSVNMPWRGVFDIRDNYALIRPVSYSDEELRKKYVGKRLVIEYLPDLSVVRAKESYAMDRPSQIGYTYLFIGLGALLFFPLILIWWNPKLATASEQSHDPSHAYSQKRKRRR